MQTRTYRDFDAFAGAVRDIDATMMLQNPTQLSWSISRLNLPGMIHVQLGRVGSGNIVEGQSYRHGYLLYLPLTDTCAYSANGTVLDKGSFMVLEPGSEFCISTQVEHDWCSVFVPAPRLARGGNLEGPWSASGKSVCRVTPANRQLSDRFWALVRQIMITAANCSQFESSPAATSAAAELVKLTSLVVGQRQPGDPHQEGRPRVSRKEIIGRSRQLLQERDSAGIHVGELAAAAQVSERTLRTAFNEYFGVGPVRYLQLSQLHRVHRALRAADPEAISVTEVLVQHGEWDFGRFASRYRRQFGELPSQTLGKMRRRRSARAHAGIHWLRRYLSENAA